jgi:hypothetical protein
MRPILSYAAVTRLKKKTVKQRLIILDATRKILRHRGNIQDMGEWTNGRRTKWNSHVPRMDLDRNVRTTRITFLKGAEFMEESTQDCMIHSLQKRVRGLKKLRGG